MAETVIILQAGDLLRRGAHDHQRVGRLLKETVEDIAAYAASAGQRNAPRRTGNLARNITSTQAHVGPDGAVEASAGVRRTAPYGPYVEGGTGIFGPRGTPIRPVTGNLLVFEIGGSLVFTKQVKGQPARRYMRRAYVETTSVYIRPRLEKLTRDVGNL